MFGVTGRPLVCTPQPLRFSCVSAALSFVLAGIHGRAGRHDALDPERRRAPIEPIRRLGHANCREALFDGLAEVRGLDDRLDRYVEAMRPLIDEMMKDEFLARAASEAIARALQGAELARHSTPEVIDVFMKTRLGGGMNSTNNWGAMFGTLGAGVTQSQADKIIDRACVIHP
jgi:hypothetical protein